MWDGKEIFSLFISAHWMINFKITEEKKKSITSYKTYYSQIYFVLEWTHTQTRAYECARVREWINKLKYPFDQLLLGVHF